MSKTNLQILNSTSQVAGKTEEDYRLLLQKVKHAQDNAVEITVDVKEIQPYPNQPRKYFNPEALRRLSKSIEHGGQQVAGLVRKHPTQSGYELIDGERRWRAIGDIPDRPLYKAKLIEADDDDVVQFLISGIANFNREGHTAMETCDTIERLLGFNFPMTEIAGLLGISEFWAHQIHGLRKLAPSVKTFLNPDLPKKNQLPATVAMDIAKVPEGEQYYFAKKFMDKEISAGVLKIETHKRGKQTRTIQERKVNPYHKWKSFQTKFDVALKVLTEAGYLSDTAEIKKFLNAEPTARKMLLGKLRKISQDAILLYKVLNPEDQKK